VDAVHWGIQYEQVITTVDRLCGVHLCSPTLGVEICMRLVVKETESNDWDMERKHVQDKYLFLELHLVSETHLFQVATLTLGTNDGTFRGLKIRL
jgi:hypothetical protein